MYKKIQKCRICENENLELVVDLGVQALTGVFPKQKEDKITSGPLRLVKCHGDNCCGLLQLEHSYSLDEMYGDNYGYRSGLNLNMVEHLKSKVKNIQSMISLGDGDLVLDIGSNDSTTLRAYDSDNIELVGIDPTGAKFSSYYPSNIGLIADFFSADLVKDRFPGRKAKVITSFSMFYDLESPMEFMREIFDILEDGGIWVFEQSYMPSMLDANSYDTICHEHLEFYALAQIKWMTDRVGFKILDVEFNDINGGSFSVVVTKAGGDTSPCEHVLRILEEENKGGLHTLEPYRAFEKRIEDSRAKLVEFFRQAKNDGKTVAAIGASTKGNVLLQYCGVTSDQIYSVGEVNPDKYGSYTPGTFIPIVPESSILAEKPDYLLVLPWHFREFFTSSPAFKGMQLVFPLPELEIVQVDVNA